MLFRDAVRKVMEEWLKQIQLQHAVDAVLGCNADQADAIHEAMLLLQR